MALAPDNHNNLICAGTTTRDAGYHLTIARTTDAGTTWQSDNSFEATDAVGVAFAPSDPSRVYVAGYFGSAAPELLVSDDSGATWESRATGLAGVPTCLAVDPNDPDVVYCGTNSPFNGIYKSVDAGASWTESGLADVRALAIDPLDNTVYAGTGTGIFLSADAGATWQDFSEGLADSSIVSLALEHTPDMLAVYAGTNRRGTFVHTVIQSGTRESGVRAIRFGTSPTLAVGPNPCHGSAEIRFTLPWPGSVRLALYDETGRLVRAVPSGDMTRIASVLGRVTGRLELDASDLPRGLYLLRLESGSAGVSQKLVIR